MRFYRSLNPVYAMTFDLDDTLYDNHPVIVRLERDLRAWLINEFPALEKFTTSDWRHLKKLAWQSSDACRHDVTVARQTQLRFAFEMINMDSSSVAPAVEQTMQQVNLLRNRVTIPAESLNTLAQLSRKIPLVAITNGNVDLDKIGLSPFFKATFKAGPNGLSKPHPDMFDQAARFLDIEPASILHVGDHLVSDVLGAKAAGFQAAWFNDSCEGIERKSKARVVPDVEITRIQQLLHFI